MREETSNTTAKLHARSLAGRGLPFDAFGALAAPISPARQAQLVWWFVWLGVAARCVRFFLRFPLWDDESFLAINFIDRGFAELAEPLDFHQVAPLGFLWAEWGMTRVFGFNEWSLRLVSFVASLGALFLFRHVAARLLSGMSLVMAVAVFAVAYPGIRYAAEAKPYGSDLFVSLCLAAMCVEWWRTPQLGRKWLWRMAAFAPLAVFFSYPAVFMGGALSLFVAWIGWRDGDRRVWPAWMAYNSALVGSFFLVLLFAAKDQTGAELEWMGSFWNNAFPPLAEPWKLPGWLVLAHTGDLLAYPVGGGRGASTLSAICVAVAVIYLARRGKWELLALCLLPLALNLLAAAMHRYPYGGHVKLVHYAAAPICMLIGVGIARLLASHARRHPTDWRMAWGVLGVLAIVAAASMVRDIARPYKTLTDARARDFARWFWFNASHDAEVACPNTDFGQPLWPEVDKVLNWTAMYECNRAIYAPAAARRRGARLDAVTNEHPLRCVHFRSPLVEEDAAAFAAWMADMRSRFDLANQETIPLACYDKRERKLLNVDQVTIYEFTPRDDVAAKDATLAR